MSKRVIITDEASGNIEFNELVDGGYSLQYTKNTDGGDIHVFGKINNGKYGDRHWIKNIFYEPLAEKLIAKFEELRHIKACRILFIEDYEFEGKESTKDKWIARVKKSNKELQETWGYWYVMETRQYYIENLSDNQLTALIYHELRHIGKYGDIVKHDIEDWSNIVNILGKDWSAEHCDIDDILDEDFMWTYNRKKQITLTDYEKQRIAQ